MMSYLLTKKKGSTSICIYLEKSMSYLNKGQRTNDKNKRKYRHMSLLPFPVCEYAAIHYKNGRRLEKL